MQPTVTKFITQNINKFSLKAILQKYEFDTIEDLRPAIHTCLQNIIKNKPELKKKAESIQQELPKLLEADFVHRYFAEKKLKNVIVVEEISRQSYAGQVRRQFYQAESSTKKQKTTSSEAQVAKEEEQEEEELNEISFLSSTTDGTFESPKSSNDVEVTSRKFVLTFDELVKTKGCSDIQELDSSFSLDDRLALSCIEVLGDGAHMLKSKELPENSYALTRRWRRAIDQNDSTFFLVASCHQEMHLISLLSTVYSNILQDNEAKRMNHKHCHPEDLINKEQEFIIKYVAPLFTYIFASSNKITVCWDRSSQVHQHTDRTILRCQRPDIIFITSDGQEIGNGEIKPYNADAEAVEEDVARVAELCKKQLHRRIVKSKTVLEHKTFGVTVAGCSVSLWMVAYEKKKYSYSKVETFTLPTLYNTYNGMDGAIEHLFAFKEMMMESLPATEDIDQAYLSGFEKSFKPTISFTC